MYINEEFLEKIKNGESFFYLFEFFNKNENFYFTTNDIDVYLNNNHYISGCLSDKIPISNFEKSGDFDIQLLKYDFLKIEEIINSSVIVKIATKDESIIIFNGFISKINYDNNLLNINISSNIKKLNQSICQLFSPICRECIGSNKCCVNLDNYKSIGFVEKIISNDCFIGNHNSFKKTESDYYKYGLIKFISGKLSGITMQIKNEIEDSVYLLRNTTLISVGDRYEIYAGCDKTLLTCKNKFNNIENFRGEPYINNEY